MIEVFCRHCGAPKGADDEIKRLLAELDQARAETEKWKQLLCEASHRLIGPLDQAKRE
jgi:hypothetical protein